MKNYIVYTICLFVVYLILVQIFFTNTHYLAVIHGYVFFISIIVPFYLVRFNNKAKQQKGISLGMIYFVAMLIISTIGNINCYIASYLGLLRLSIIPTLNLYWILGMLMFAEGYFSVPTRNIIFRSVFKITKPIAYSILFLAIIGTVFSIVGLKNIPFFSSGKGFDEDDIQFAGNLFPKLWFLNIIASMTFFYMYIKSRKKIHLTLAIVCMSLTLLLNLRIQIMLAMLGCCMVYVVAVKYDYRKFIILSISALFIFAITNFLVRDNRGDKVEGIRGLSSAQMLVRSNLNEYPQLGMLIDLYKDEPLYGKTFLRVPAGFIPAFILKPFGFAKDDLAKYNSAIILAKLLNSRSSIGVRSGIMGELYVNFLFFGVIFMFVIGRIVALINNSLKFLLHFSDFRIILLLSIYCLLVYSLIGQLNVIGTYLGVFLVFGSGIMFLFKNKHMIN